MAQHYCCNVILYCLNYQTYKFYNATVLAGRLRNVVLQMFHLIFVPPNSWQYDSLHGHLLQI